MEIESIPSFIPFKERADLWKDIEPVPQFSDKVEILKIDYSDKMKEINDYFRAIIHKNELSIRAYDLTTELIMASATNYMAWYHRRLCLDNVKELDLHDELEWLDSITVENQKNYQIWHHRKVLIEKLNDPSHEKKLLDEVFDDEPKNFHAWCHRIWVIRRFNLYEGELDYIERKLNEDIRNNSVWNYRFFIITHINNNCLSDEVIKNEIEYTLDKIVRMPINESPYSYVRGLLKPITKILKYMNIKSTVEKVIEDYPECYHAYSLLLDWYEQENNTDKCAEIIDTLSDVDHIRAKYWTWRKNNLLNKHKIKI